MISKMALYCIDIYRKYISGLKYRRSCRFYPTCSDYAYQSIKKHGFLKGMFYSIMRILKCHPFHPGGYDPVK